MRGKPIAIFLAGLFIVSRLGGENSPDVDEVVGDDAQSHPSTHTVMAAISTPIQSMSAFQYADSTFAAGSPLLTFSKPSGLLNLAKSRILGRTIRNGNVFDTHLLDRGFVSR